MDQFVLENDRSDKEYVVYGVVPSAIISYYSNSTDFIAKTYSDNPPASSYEYTKFQYGRLPIVIS
jgi:hypothetical protein